MKLIFKHSTVCPISIRAKREVENFLADYIGELDFELVDVRENRLRSDEIIETFGITHESPQAILLDENNQLIWHASHRAVKVKNLEKAVSKS